MIISYQNLLGLQNNHELAQLAWNYMSDGLRTSIFMRYSVETIACACLHLGMLHLNIPAPEWWQAFDATTEDVEEIWYDLLILSLSVLLSLFLSFCYHVIILCLLRITIMFLFLFLLLCCCCSRSHSIFQFLSSSLLVLLIINYNYYKENALLLIFI